MAFVTRSEKHHDKAQSCVYIDIQSKEGQLYRYRVNELFTEEVDALMNYVDIFAFPYQKQNFFAFEYGKNDTKLEEKYEGWKIYDIEKEFKRQGVLFKSLADSQHANSPTTPHKFKKGVICLMRPQKINSYRVPIELLIILSLIFVKTILLKSLYLHILPNKNFKMSESSEERIAFLV